MKQKIILSLFALFIFLAIGTATAVIYMSSNINELKNIIKLHEVEELRRSLVIKVQNVQTDLYTINPIFIDDFDDIVYNASDLRQTAQKCSSCHHDPKLTDRIEEVQNLVRDYEISLSYYLTASANTNRIQRLKMDASSIGKKLISLTGAMSHSASKSIQEKTNHTMDRMNHVRIILFITIIITFLLGVIIAVHLTKSITQPISALVNATRMISSGKLGSTISYKDNTEFGELARHFNIMSTAVKEGYEKIHKEISERKQAEEALRESEARFRTFFEMSPVGILIYPFHPEPFRKALKQATFNSAFHNFFDYTREELNNKSNEEISHPEDMNRNIELIDDMLAGKHDSFKMEKRYFNKKGEVVWGYLNVTAIRNLKGEPTQVMTTLVDITERKKMEEEQIKIEKLESVGILAGGIAHDFNNILTSIVVNIARAKMSLNSRKELSAILTDVEDGCRRAKDLTNKLITFSRGGTPVKRVISIKDQLKDSSLFAVRGTDTVCKFQIPDDLWYVEVDEGQMNQVIVNLVINAVQAMPDGGCISIEAENFYPDTNSALPANPTEFVKISVRDEGVGIRQEHINKIFDPYFTTKQKGSGLGLSSAYSIIKNHHGYIDVESTGRGSVFYIYLPAIKDVQPFREDNKNRNLQSEGKILIMDDDDNLRNSLSKSLEQLGYETELAREGAEAIAIYKEALRSENPFDAVIMDLTISEGMGGKEAIRVLLEIDPDVKAIVSSGYSDDSIMANYKNCGFSGIMTKPYEIEALSALLNSVINEMA